MIARIVITANILHEFIAAAIDEEVDGAAIGTRTGADGEETGLVGAETGAATGPLLGVGAVDVVFVVGDITGALTGLSMVGETTGASTVPPVATKVHVLAQSIKMTHSQGNGNVIDSSPGSSPKFSS